MFTHGKNLCFAGKSWTYSGHPGEAERRGMCSQSQEILPAAPQTSSLFLCCYGVAAEFTRGLSVQGP